ncbi:hypothetical protein E2562_001164 [Oryza meyeriana var. granulata]|uniref:Uncharacterized protein n=1 Tax=Oryza meyeriana var. granulata TaxID=110450 RepID=A0A6G1EDB7_9ORYZ|nr:hypothetical protein E2562_001164 [Oryza meyeriana var. granulata]
MMTRAGAWGPRAIPTPVRPRPNPLPAAGSRIDGSDAPPVLAISAARAPLRRQTTATGGARVCAVADPATDMLGPAPDVALGSRFPGSPANLRVAHFHPMSAPPTVRT